MASEWEDGQERQRSTICQQLSCGCLRMTSQGHREEKTHMHSLSFSPSLSHMLLSTEVKLYKGEREKEIFFRNISPSLSSFLCPLPPPISSFFPRESIFPGPHPFPSSQPPSFFLDVKSISVVLVRQQYQEGKELKRSDFLLFFLFVQSHWRICLPSWSIIVSLLSSITLNPPVSPPKPYAMSPSIPSLTLFLIFCTLYSFTLLPFRC